ncbi:hypothetical protein [Cytobacillus praedii]|uniref:hypothetical protein n=1 Tax=Cytobacillus praedii TaxID=1742358 RepID=UPI002E1A7ADC|nr:hypothetical protein [Cytobacillus praedii]
MMDKKALKSNEGIGKVLSEIVVKVLEKLYEITSHIDWSKINDPLAELGRVFKETGDDLIRFKSITVELGYPPHLDMSIPIIRKIVKDYDEYGKEYVSNYIDEIMFEFYNEEYMCEIQKKWYRKRVLKPILPILDNVIKAHTQQMYYSSVSTLLPQLEGLIAKTFRHTGELKGNQLKTYLKHLLIDKDVEKRAYSFDEAIHKYYKTYILVRFKHGDEIVSDISRHAILHGGDVQYGSKKNSLKLILLFDYLNDCLSTVNESVIEEAKLELMRKCNK